MNEYKCPKCNSTNLFTRKKDTQTGLYCKECGKWIKWLNKEEARVFETDTNDGCKWISVKDRLPERSSNYLTCRYGDIMSVLSYSVKYKLFNANDDLDEKFSRRNAVNVDYWMPLPEAPEEE